jgi:hypothetical protein
MAKKKRAAKKKVASGRAKHGVGNTRVKGSGGLPNRGGKKGSGGLPDRTKGETKKGSGALPDRKGKKGDGTLPIRRKKIVKKTRVTGKSQKATFIGNG